MEENRFEYMISYTPLYYQMSEIFKTILGSEGIEFDILRDKIEDLKAQFFINTATWGLELWEKQYGLVENNTLSCDERRSRIKGKMRGTGKVGSELIKTVAEAYSNGEVSVGFDGNIIITFIGTRGIPSALEELKKQLNEIVPAHLGVQYKFTYAIWDEFDVMSCDEQETMTWDKLEVYKPLVKKS